MMARGCRPLRHRAVLGTRAGGDHLGIPTRRHATKGGRAGHHLCHRIESASLPPRRSPCGLPQQPPIIPPVTQVTRPTLSGNSGHPPATDGIIWAPALLRSFRRRNDRNERTGCHNPELCSATVNWKREARQILNVSGDDELRVSRLLDSGRG